MLCKSKFYLHNQGKQIYRESTSVTSSTVCKIPRVSLGLSAAKATSPLPACRRTDTSCQQAGLQSSTALSQCQASVVRLSSLFSFLSVCNLLAGSYRSPDSTGPMGSDGKMLPQLCSWVNASRKNYSAGFLWPVHVNLCLLLVEQSALSQAARRICVHENRAATAASPLLGAGPFFSRRCNFTSALFYRASFLLWLQCFTHRRLQVQANFTSPFDKDRGFCSNQSRLLETTEWGAKAFRVEGHADARASAEELAMFARHKL